MANIYQKVQDMRVALQAMNIKKTGKNKHMGYTYYELGDFMPPINQLMKEHGVCGVVSYGADAATLTLFNAEKPEESIVFASPMAEAKLSGAHPIQNLGAVETYQRRYLYMTAFEIVEADVLDASQGSDKGAQTPRGKLSISNTYNQKKPAQQPKKPREQRPKQSNLPEDTSEQLNAAIKAAKVTTGMSVQEIVAELEQRTGIKMQEVTVETAATVLATIDETAGVETPF